MTKSKRLKPIAELAEQNRQEAAKTMRESEQTLKAYTARLEELETYREHYMQRFVIEGSGGLQAHQLKDYRVFLSNLELAISELKEQIRMASVQHKRDKDEWDASHRRSRALEKAVMRFTGDERARAVRVEQQQLDESAQRAAPHGARLPDET